VTRGMQRGRLQRRGREPQFQGWVDKHHKKHSLAATKREEKTDPKLDLCDYRQGESFQWGRNSQKEKTEQKSEAQFLTQETVPGKPGTTESKRELRELAYRMEATKRRD